MSETHFEVNIAIPRPKPRRNPAPALILTPKKASLQNFSALILAMLLADLLGVAQA